MPESWQIRNGDPPVIERTDIPALKAGAMEVLTWLRGWVISGSTLFIHRRIYRDTMPRCLQDAYTACATYFSSSQHTKDLVFRIVERNIELLLHDHAMPELAADIDSCDFLQRLARTQAMLVYQAIRLYDGDIRQRAAADGICSTLDSWNHEMLKCAMESSQYVWAFSSGRSQNDAAAWDAWCLAESVRRTWATINVTQNAYRVLKGEESRCPGHLRFTARVGLWDAPSCVEWMTAHRERDPLFYTEENGSDIVAKAKPDEIDEFGRWALRVCRSQFGVT